MIDCFRRITRATLLMALTENGCLLVMFLIYDVSVLTVKYRYILYIIVILNRDFSVER